MTDNLIKPMALAYWGAEFSTDDEMGWADVAGHTRENILGGMRAALAAIQKTHAVVHRNTLQRQIDIIDEATAERQRSTNITARLQSAAHRLKSILTEDGQ